MVRTGSEKLNHLELLSSSTAGLVSRVELWFEQVRKRWTTLNSWEIILWSLFPLELRDSTRFGRVEQPQTHEKLSYVPCSICSSVVRTGSKRFNYMSSSTAGLVSCVELWFEQVRKSWITPNSGEIVLRSLFPLELSGSNRFGRVKPPRTHVKFHRRPGFLCWTIVLYPYVVHGFKEVR